MWRWSSPQAGAEIAQVLSADPLVVMITHGGRSRDAEVWKVDRESGEHVTVWEGTIGDTSPCDQAAPSLRHCPRGRSA
ncbi:hypothetical protein E1292_09595 [Nonomuraea deserti]|uniref:Uncharacterized protein n=1 Tax=Nonomuraea deserti TaxID=1848322 RepID=A0A4R4W8I2_9ACTN|nr:hypothetical protein [Nonomuraea deserti]TDD09530.1 hypothetical protein E1292_09595 [Nonomuraea deserti]